MSVELELGSARESRKFAVSAFWKLHKDRLWGPASILVGLVLWEVLSAYVIGNTLMLASPTQILGAIGSLMASGELQRHFYVSAQEFLWGYVSGCVFGVLIGLAMANSIAAQRSLQPWVSGLYATPTVALAPLFILWFGVGILSKVIVVALLVIFPVIINTEAGIRTTSPQLIETVRSFGATRLQIFTKVLLPSALPFIFAGLKLGIGRGLIGVVVAELFGARAGLGQLISQSAETFDMPSLFAGVTVLAVAGILLTNAFAWLERKLVPWR